MKQDEMKGFVHKKNKLFTLNPEKCKKIKVYNEKIVKIKGKEYRSWNPYRSKLAAAILKGYKLDLKTDSKVLYLGAATGTTVSHVSDIVQKGLVFSVENSPVALKSLLTVSEYRENIIPILEDANHPDRYSPMVSQVDFIYQDISQRNQAEIFVKNINHYLKKDGIGVIMVKARSIDVSLKPNKAFEIVASELKNNSLKIIDQIDISHYEKDHMAIFIRN